MLTLYSFAGDFRALKALIAAQYNAVEINKPKFELGKDDTTAEFKAKSPAGKVPILETPQGIIFESNAIARYVARIRRDTELLGKSFFESGQVDAWIDFAAHELELPVSMWTYPVLGWAEFKQAVHEKAVEDTYKALATLERHLLNNTFLVGNAVTLADIITVAVLVNPFRLVFDPTVQSAYPSVTRWFLTCVNQPAFAAVLGEVNLCQTAMGAAAGKPKAAAPKKEKEAAKPKEEKKKEEPKKKEEKVKEPEDAADALIAAEPKKADPFAALPKSNFVLDEWKRTYSNSKDNFYASMDWFWANYDAAGYSIWLAKYQYNNENKRDFMTSNLVGGFIQRSDEVRRYAFGMMHVLNTAAPFEVAGMWLMRGQSIQPMLECNPDAEYYTWTKLENLDDATKKLVADYWCAQTHLADDIGGPVKEIYDSRVFK